MRHAISELFRTLSPRMLVLLASAGSAAVLLSLILLAAVWGLVLFDR